MKNVHYIFRNTFLNALEANLKNKMERVEIGNYVSVKGKCGSKFVGNLKCFDEAGIVIEIKDKSRVVVNANNVMDLDV